MQGSNLYPRRLRINDLRKALNGEIILCSFLVRPFGH